MDPLDKFLEELAEREKKIKSQEFQRSLQRSESHNPALGHICTPDDYERVVHYTSSFPDRYSRKEIYRKCQRSNKLTVRKVANQKLIGMPDQWGQLVLPAAYFTEERLQMFVAETVGQWVIVPMTGYTVRWTSPQWRDGHLVTIPMLDEIKEYLDGYPSVSLFNLHQTITDALGLYPLSMPRFEW
jgi:hypothetical protein